MKKNLVAAGALGCALLLAPIESEPAQAFRGGHGGMAFHGGGGFHSPGGWGFHSRPLVFSHARPFFFRHHHRFRNFAFIGFPYYDYDYYYGGGCGWLHRRAIYTGSRYWWYRYYQCIGY